MTRLDSHIATFRGLHVSGDPVILFNIWDAGSAKAVAQAGARAIATGSASVSGAMGYNDAEEAPLEDVIANLKRICAAVDLPVTLDFESGYARSPEELAENVKRVIEAGAVGINFEDQMIGGAGLYDIEEQSSRIAAIREAADLYADGFFINARTDVWLSAGQKTLAADRQMEEALLRLKAYMAAGADGFFIPGLADESAIRQICDQSQLPVNVMMFDGMPSKANLTHAGVARISHGPFPWRAAMAGVTQAAANALAA
jgi:2-methylisocitrate lyase-like PEP mutase family enzyme